MANFVVILLVSFMLLALAQALGGGGMPGGGMPGGWSFVDPRDERVQSAARFAVTTKYPDRAPQFIVVMARKQVVAGLNYDLTVEVSSVDACHVDHFQVYDRFGDLSLTLSEVMIENCGSIGSLRGPKTEGGPK